MLLLACASIVLLCLLVILGVPIIVSLTAAILMYLMFSGGWSLALPQQTLAGISDYILVTMPLFIFAGAIMNASGIADRLFAFAGALVGWMRGGLAHVNVTSSIMFGGMVGTSVADLAGTGSIMIPKLKQNNYPGPFAAALTATSSGIGILIPPSSPMILYSAVTGVSLGALFLAGVLPGLLMGLLLMLIVAIQARRHGWKPISNFAWNRVLTTGMQALLPMGLPFLVLGGLVVGLFTPSEAGAFAVAYALVLAMLVYRTLSFAQLYRAMVNSTVLTGEILLVVGLSTSFGWALSQAGVPSALAAGLDTLFPFESVVLRVLVLLLLALIAGMVLDPLIPMIMPILLPALMAMDVDLLHFGVLIIVTVVIGQVTPPVALALLVAAKIGNEDVTSVIRANTLFLITLFAFLLLLVFIPQLSMALPTLMQ